MMVWVRKFKSLIASFMVINTLRMLYKYKGNGHGPASCHVCLFVSWVVKTQFHCLGPQRLSSLLIMAALLVDKILHNVCELACISG